MEYKQIARMQHNMNICIHIKYRLLFMLFSCWGFSTIAQTCDTISKNVENLGIYGGLTIDYAFSQNGRLFAASMIPASLFISDDTAKTWYKAFSYDSLEYECGTRGWGGGSEKVLTNQKGWVAVHTEEINGGLSSCVLNLNNGDSGKWYTAIDGYLIAQLGYDSKPVTGIGLSDYYLYALLKSYIIRVDNTNKIDTATIIDLATAIPGIDTLNSTLTGIAIANSTTGFPFYFIVDSVESTVNTPRGKLYKFNGSSAIAVTTPSALVGITRIFTHPHQLTGDTIFISGKTSSGKPKIYRSFNGGTSWTNITPSTGCLLKDVEYSSAWNFTASNNLLLINDIAGFSFDLGNTWISSGSLSQHQYAKPFSLALFPNDSSIVVAGDKVGSYKSESGISGPFTTQSNEGFEAILTWDIDRNDNKTVFYLGTQSGLAYTTKYNDNSINNIDKWTSPNGAFPLDSITTSIYAVAINPSDSLHVIAGAQSGLYMSSTGPTGFVFTIPPGYDQSGTVTQDIAFVDSTTVIAITGTLYSTFQGNGEIWRSSDGGINWNKVSPSSFGTGRSIAVGHTDTSTVIYVASGLSGYEHGVLWKSTDLGLNWTQVNTGPDALSTSQLSINKIIVDPRGVDTLYLLATYDTTNAFVKSTDGGISYQDLLTTINNNEKNFNAIEIDPNNPDSIIYLARDQKLYQYNPLTDSAILIHTGLPGEETFDIAIGSILAGTTTGFYSIEPDTSGEVVSIVDLPTAESMLQLGIFPNPVSQQANVRIQNIQKNSMLKISILSLTGQTLQNLVYEKVNQNDLTFALDMRLLTTGIYYLKVTSSNDVVCKRFCVVTN